jgi:hypothetical protein
VLAEADHHHLAQAAFDVAVKIGVRLDPPAKDDVIGLAGKSIGIHGKAQIRLAQHHRFHRRPHWAAAAFFGHTVRFENLPLTLCRAAAVAPHRRHDEWFSAELF